MRKTENKCPQKKISFIFSIFWQMRLQSGFRRSDLWPRLASATVWDQAKQLKKPHGGATGAFQESQPVPAGSGV